MLSALQFSGYRGFDDIRFEQLGQVNLILGGNNTGKTSVLEALVLMFGDKKQMESLPGTFRRLSGQKEDAVPHFWKLLRKDGTAEHTLLFAEYGNTEPPHTSDVSGGSQNTANGSMRLVGKSEQGTWSLMDQETPRGYSRVTIQDQFPHIHAVESAFPLSIVPTRQADPKELSELFNHIAPLVPANEDRLQKLLKDAIEPRLGRLRYAKPEGTRQHLVYAEVGPGPMIPFTQMGQAFARTLEIYCEIFANRPKILLIDEIENGLYYEGLSDFWNGLFEVTADQGVQIFATTHSRECMEAACAAAKQRKDEPLRYLRLDRRVDDPGKVVATTFGVEEMETAIRNNLEMR